MKEENEELEEETPQGQGKKGAERVIKVIHKLMTDKGSETNEENIDEYEGMSKEELAQKLSERETQLGQISLKAFTEEVKEVKKAMKEQFDKDVEIEDTRELEAYKKLLGESETEEDETEEGLEGTIYSGKGQDLSKTGGQVKQPSKRLQSGFERGSQIIDALYDAIDEERYNRKYNPEKFDAKRLKEAERKVDKIWKSLKKGFVKRDYRLMPQGSRRSIWTCPKCSTTNIDTMRCSNPQCEYKVPETEAQWHKIR